MRVTDLYFTGLATNQVHQSEQLLLSHIPNDTRGSGRAQHLSSVCSKALITAAHHTPL